MKECGPTRIVIADDHSIVREGLAAIINCQPDMEIVGEARDWPEAVAQVLRHRPEIAFTDLHMPGGDAADLISSIVERFPPTKIVVFSAFDGDEEVYEALRAGARGYILKGESDRDELMRCVRAVLEGQVWIHPSAATRLAEHMKAPALTKRERDILRLLVAGQSNKEIGSSLNVTEGTVKVHLNHIFAKLGVEGRVAAIGVAVQRGIAHFADSGPLDAHLSKGSSKQTAA